MKSQKTGLLRDVLNNLFETAPKFTRHEFIKRQQSAFFQEKKKGGNESSAVLQVDFAENCTAGYQDEIQAAHWNQIQITIFTAVSWIKEEAQS